MAERTGTLVGRDWRGRSVGVRIAGGLITDVQAARGAVPDVTLLPGLHDHHVHLRAAAARRNSLDLSGYASHEGVLAALAAAAAGGRAVRAVGWDDTATGRLTRDDLDVIGGTRIPLRVQHRSGHLWVISSAAARLLDTDVPDDGALWDRDEDLAPLREEPDAASIQAIAAEMNRRGVIAADDLTPGMDAEGARRLHATVSHRLRLAFFGRADAHLDGVKLVLPDHALPSPEDIAARILAARPGPAAVHTVSAETLVLLLAAGSVLERDDRIEHAFVTPPEVPEALAALLPGARPAIGVQPGFLHSHGDRHLARGSVGDVADYQRLRRWLDAGFRLLGGTDAPFGPGDPWLAMQRAVDRTTERGAVLGAEEALSPEEAFTLFTADGLDERGPRLDIIPGARADLCVLRGRWAEIRSRLDRANIVATVADGAIAVLEDDVVSAP